MFDTVLGQVTDLEPANAGVAAIAAWHPRPMISSGDQVPARNHALASRNFTTEPTVPDAGGSPLLHEASLQVRLSAACDQPRYVRSGRPLVNWVEAYSASQVMASDPVGSLELVPVPSALLPASTGA